MGVFGTIEARKAASGGVICVFSGTLGGSTRQEGPRLTLTLTLTLTLIQTNPNPNPNHRGVDETRRPTPIRLAAKRPTCHYTLGTSHRQAQLSNSAENGGAG